MTAVDDPACDLVGRCTASRVTGCTADRTASYSGGKLLELGDDGAWYTWEARFLPPDQRRP